MTARRYITHYVLALMALSMFVITFNFGVDPYLIFASPRVEGLNKIKVDINNHVRTAKSYQPFGRHWNTLLIGNSRIELGLNPQHRCFQAAGAAVYNLGIPGAGVRQQLEYALNVIYDQPVERVFVSVDFVDFLVSESTEPPPESSSQKSAGSLRYRFDGSENPDYLWNRTVDRYQALFSLDALSSSVRTVAMQSRHQPDRDNFGFNPARDFDYAVSLEGAYALFAQKLASLDSKYQDKWSLQYRDGSLTRDFETLNRFLAIAANRNIDVILFTNPFHQTFWELLKTHGLYELHGKWLALLEEALRKAAGSPRLWNFSLDSEFIHEEIPRPGLKSGPLRWFWEPSHYRRELGDKMLDAMLAGECGPAPQLGQQLL